jgi:methyl-accepting chemotaxis protein
MFNSLFSRLFATIFISLFILVVGYGIYTAMAFGQLTKNVSESLDELTTNSLEQQLTRQVDDSARIVETAYRGLALNVELVFKTFSFMIPADRLVIGLDRIDLAGKSLPAIGFDGQLLNNNYALVDTFTAMTDGSVATIFVRDGDNFVRVSTSLKKEDGSRAVGTNLDVKHPAFEKIMRGESYTGLADLFGKKYMTHYQPVMRDGKAIAIAFVGYDATKEFESLTTQLKSIKIGATGYLFALNSKGVLVLHPTREGKDISNKKDANGFAYIQEQLASAKEGKAKLIHYTIPDKEGETPRDKIAAYTLLPSLGWILSSSAYPEEFTSAFDQAKSSLINRLSDIQTYALMLLVLSGVLMLIVLFFVLHYSLKSLADLSTTMKRIVSSGDLSQRAPVNSVKEVKLVALEFNQLIEQMDYVVGETENVLSALGNGSFDLSVQQTYPGKLGDLSTAVNDAIKQVSNTVADIDGVMKSLADGRFGTDIHEGSAKGAFKHILMQAKAASGFLSTTIADINTVMHKMNDGDFNARVNANAAGDLLAMKNNINNSMDNIAKAIVAISHVVSAQADGDLTKALPSGEFKGQLHDLKNAINYSSAKVKDVVAQTIASSNIVSDAANQVSQGASDLSARVQQQAAALEETSSTMNQMSSAVQANTANARKVADLTNQVQDQAKDGVDVMQQTIGAMQSIKESSSKISDIVTIIDGIAFQTNLLALNAAVEAARAGEHGRGFAVVASEVRALAGKSADAAKDIKTLITDSVTRIENGTHLADKSGEMLNGIAGSIHQVAAMVEQIATASNEQSVGINQVHRAIADIDKMTQENAALVEETTAAAESLNHEAAHLAQNMAFFKTGQSTTNLNARLTSRPQAAKAIKKPAALPAPKKANGEEWGEF